MAPAPQHVGNVSHACTASTSLVGRTYSRLCLESMSKVKSPLDVIPLRRSQKHAFVDRLNAACGLGSPDVARRLMGRRWAIPSTSW